MRYSHRSPRHRPSWWPENETWPPQGRPRFFRRMGCVFMAFLLLSVMGGFTLLALAMRALGWESVIPPWQPGGTLTLVVLGALFFLGLLIG
jgi:hypothetical protein